MLDGYTCDLGRVERKKGHLCNWRNTVMELSEAHHDLQRWEAVRLRALMRCGRRARHAPKALASFLEKCQGWEHFSAFVFSFS